MNVVYLCIDNGEQLRYSLRSLEQCTGVSRVLLIGAKPDWYKGEFIAHKKRLPLNTQDQAEKLLIALNHLNEPFVYVHDDHIFTQSLDFDNLPHYCENQTLAQKIVNYKGSLGYLRHLQSTHNYMRAGNLPDICCENHVTTKVDNLPLFRMCLAAVLNHPQQLQFQSLYGASVGANEPLGQLKPYQEMPLSEVLEFIKSRPYISINEKSMQYGVGEFLRSNFVKKSKYEL
jgi:hypothetical protein